MVMKFCGWIDLIKGERSAHEPPLLFACSLSYCPLLIFHTLIWSGAYLQNYTSYGYEILWVDRSQGGVQCTWSITLVFCVIALC